MPNEEKASSSSVTCPSCDGRGKSFVHVNMGESEHQWGFHPCRRCKGTKEVPAESIEWEAIGYRIRLWRLRNKLTLRDFAHRIRISATKLSAFESGLQDPAGLKAIVPKSVWKEITGEE